MLMNDRLGPLKEAIQLNFEPRRHSALLIAIVAAFAVRPMIGDSGSGPAVFGVALLSLLLIGVYNVNVDELVNEGGRLTARVRRRRIIGWALAFAVGLARISVIFMHNYTLNLLETFCLLAFVLFVTVGELRSVLRQREVTGETICRYATVAEAITGQFYLAILVARLVGLQMSHSANRNAD